MYRLKAWSKDHWGQLTEVDFESERSVYAVAEEDEEKHSTLSSPVSLEYSSWNSKAELVFWLVLKNPKMIAWGLLLIRNMRNTQLGSQSI